MVTDKMITLNNGVKISQLDSLFADITQHRRLAHLW